MHLQEGIHAAGACGMQVIWAKIKLDDPDDDFDDDVDDNDFDDIHDDRLGDV